MILNTLVLLGETEITPTTLWIGAIGAVIISVLTVILTKGVEAWIAICKASNEAASKKREDERKDKDLNEQKVLKGYDLVISSIKERVHVLEEALSKQEAKYETLLEKSRLEHLECLKNTERMKARIEVLETQVREVGSHVFPDRDSLQQG